MTLTGLSPSTTYYYQSAAVNSPPGSIAPFAGFSPIASFTTPPPPTFTSISPSSGSIAGGTTATITGTNFTGATSVTIGGIPVTSFTVNSATSITITTPAGTSLGAQNVVVTCPGGTATGPGAFTYIAQVTFNANGGSGSMPIQSGSSPAALTANTFTLPGSTFLGWNTAANGSGTAYADGATYPFTSSTTLYAQWLTVASVAPPAGPLGTTTPITITGTGFTGATGVTVGGVAATSVVVVNSTTITAVVPSSAVTGAVNVVVTTPAGTGTGTGLFTYEATVTFNGNGSTSGSMSTQTAAAGAALTTNSFVRTGYTFAGWNTVAGGGGTAYADGASFPFTANTTLYAQWSGVSNSVTYNANLTGTTGSVPGTSSYPTGATVTVVGNTGSLAKTGYTFAGWNTAADGSGTTYQSGNTFTMPSSAVTLYALWTAKPTVTSVSASTGDIAGTNIVTIGGTNFTGVTAVKFGTKPATGFTFVNSTTITATVPAGTATGAVAVSVTTPGGTSTTNGTYTYTVTVSYNANGGTGSVASQTYSSGSHALSSYTTFTPPTGYVFAGLPTIWNTNPGGGGTTYSSTASINYTTATSDVTLYAQYTIGSYAVSYNGNGSTGGTAPGTVSHTYNTTVTVLGNTGSLVKTGATFAGWNTATDGSGTTYQAGNTFTMPGAAVTLYARWTAAPTVTSAGSGDIAGGNTVTITGTNFTGVTGVTIGGVAATNVTFVNSTTITVKAPAGSSTGTKSVLVTTPGGTNGANTLYTYTVTVTFNANGGTGTIAPETNSVAANLTSDAGFTAPTGYSFAPSLVWSTNPGGGGTTYTNTQSFPFNTATADVTLYAQYVGNSYTVTYNDQGGSGQSGGATSYTAGASFLLPTTPPTLSGSAFAGWFTAATGGTALGTSYTPITPFGNITIYAQWVTVTSVSPSSGTLNGGTAITITGTDFTGATGATINGVPITSFAVVNSTTITGVTPA